MEAAGCGIVGRLIAVVAAAVCALAAAGEMDRQAKQWVLVTWSLENPGYRGNPFELTARVTFVHADSGRRGPGPPLPGMGRGRWGDWPRPDLRTFDALELLIRKTNAAGGIVHIWAWGDESRRQTPIRLGGKNGPADRRLQRYIAARLGPPARLDDGLRLRPGRVGHREGPARMARVYAPALRLAAHARRCLRPSGPLARRAAGAGPVRSGIGYWHGPGRATSIPAGLVEEIGPCVSS